MRLREGDLKLKIASEKCRLFGIIARKAIKIYQIIRKWKFTFLYEMINRCVRVFGYNGITVRHITMIWTENGANIDNRKKGY